MVELDEVLELDVVVDFSTLELGEPVHSGDVKMSPRKRQMFCTDTTDDDRRL